MKLEDILPAIIIIGVTVMSVSFIVTILGNLQEQTVTETLGLGEEFTVGFGDEMAVSQTDVIPGTVDIGCPDYQMIEDTDYTFDYDTSIFIIDTDRVFNNKNFTSNYDKETWIIPAETDPTPISAFESGTLAIFNCSDKSQVWTATGNYTTNLSRGSITVLSTGLMSNNTLYCTNVTGAMTYDNAHCTIEYQWYTYGEGNNELVTSGITAMGTFNDWWVILILIIISVVVIGLLQTIRQRED